jgi:hypothetical protein
MGILSAIPLEVFTGAFSAGLAFLGSVYASRMKAKAAEQQQLITRHTADEASRARAEGGSAESQEEKRWTRRTIAMIATISILVVPMIAGWAGVNVTTGWTEMSGGFWPFSDPSSHMIWHKVSGGIVITPLHTHTLSSIIGFYFGSSIAENAR